MLLKITKLRTIMIVVLVTLALSACGSAATGGNAAGSASASAQPAAVSTTAAPSTASATSSGAVSPTSQPSASTATATTAKLNLNEVTEDQLMSTIPNFSSRMVREFMEYRPYISIQQFRKEIGKYVSAEQVAAYEQFVYVPIDVDQADAATLQQLPGVDATIADQLIAGRPYGSTQAFLAKLAGYVSDSQMQQATAYLAAA
jgi:DNA uptake protein ComE-like DNA-binding protein